MLKIRPVNQKYAYCGPASLQMVLAYFGVRATQKRLARLAGTTWKYGTSHRGMARALRAFGFRTIVKRTTTTFDDLRKYVHTKKLPVIVNWYSPFNPPANGHYSVVTRISRSTITLVDPEIGRRRTMPLDNFHQLWFDFIGDLEFDKPPLKADFRWMLVAIPHNMKRGQ